MFRLQDVRLCASDGDEETEKLLNQGLVEHLVEELSSSFGESALGAEGADSCFRLLHSHSVGPRLICLKLLRRTSDAWEFYWSEVVEEDGVPQRRREHQTALTERMVFPAIRALDIAQFWTMGPVDCKQLFIAGGPSYLLEGYGAKGYHAVYRTTPEVALAEACRALLELKQFVSLL